MYIYKLSLRSNIDFIYKRHNILKLCDIVNITLLKNSYIAYTDNANTNLLRQFVKSTYTLTRPRYAFVIPKCRLNICIFKYCYCSYIYLCSNCYYLNYYYII